MDAVTTHPTAEKIGENDRQTGQIYSRSRIVTLAWPPPSHMVCMP